MMALQPLMEAMLDQPGGAIGTLQAVAAIAAQGQGRIATPVEKQQCLFALIQRPRQCLQQGWRDPGIACRLVASEIDEMHRRQLRATMAVREMQRRILATLDIGEAYRTYNDLLANQLLLAYMIAFGRVNGSIAGPQR